jgi:hypothetical protein
MLRLVWQEDGGPAVHPPGVAGFGTSMLSQAIKYQHEGKVELDWRSEGLICRLSLPVLEAASSSGSRPVGRKRVEIDRMSPRKTEPRLCSRRRGP